MSATEHTRPLSDTLPDFSTGADSSIVAELARVASTESAAHQAALDAQRAQELAAARAAGVADGMEQAGIAATRTWEQLTAQLAASEQQVRAAVRDSYAIDAAAIVDIAHTLATWVVGRELAADPAALLGQVQRVLDTVAAGTDVEVAVHPAAHDAYQRWADRHGDHTVTVVPDPTIAVGEAAVRTAAGGVSRVGAAAALRRAVSTLTDTASATSAEVSG